MPRKSSAAPPPAPRNRSAQVNVKLSAEVAASLGRLAAQLDIDRSTLARSFLKDRVDLWSIGWDYADFKVKRALAVVSHLDKESLDQLIDFLRTVLPETEWPDIEGNQRG